MTLTAWLDAIERFSISQRASGVRPATIRTRSEHLRWLARRVDAGPWSVTAEQLVDVVGRQNWAAETRRSRRTTFVEFYRWAKRAGHTRHNPARQLPKVRAEVGKPRPAPAGALAFAMIVADDRTRLILRLAAEAGLRRAEIAVIHADDVERDLVGWSLSVHGKGGKARVVPLLDDTARILRAACDGGYAFPGAIDGHLSPRRVGELAVEVLPGGVTLHQLRHSFATRAYQVEHDLAVVQELLGHSNPATTRRYVEVPSDSLRRTVEALRVAPIREAA